MAKQKFYNILPIISSIGAVLLLTGTLAASGGAQENRSAQTVGVDNTSMGAYRALAQLIYQEFQKPNYPMAAQLARILELTWDQGEKGITKKNLENRNERAFVEIDRALDLFIRPIMDYAEKPPDVASVEAAYHNFLNKLKQGDSAPAAAAAVPQATQEKPKAVHFSPDTLQVFTGKYQLLAPQDAPAGTTMPTIEINANLDGLMIGNGNGDIQHQFLPLSADEFFLRDQPVIHVIFSKNDRGQINGFHITNYSQFQRAVKCMTAC